MNKRFVLMALVLSMFFSMGLYSCTSSSTDRQLSAGYSFVLSRLKSPSNTTLVKSLYGGQIRNLVEEHCSVKLPSCITVGCFEVDTPNSFGALLRETFWVFYKNGIPCHLETSKALDKVSSTRNGRLLITALEMNGCKCEWNSNWLLWKD